MDLPSLSSERSLSRSLLFSTFYFLQFALSFRTPSLSHDLSLPHLFNFSLPQFRPNFLSISPEFPFSLFLALSLLSFTSSLSIFILSLQLLPLFHVFSFTSLRKSLALTLSIFRTLPLSFSSLLHILFSTVCSLIPHSLSVSRSLSSSPLQLLSSTIPPQLSLHLSRISIFPLSRSLSPLFHVFSLNFYTIIATSSSLLQPRASLSSSKFPFLSLLFSF